MPLEWFPHPARLGPYAVTTEGFAMSHLHYEQVPAVLCLGLFALFFHLPSANAETMDTSANAQTQLNEPDNDERRHQNAVLINPLGPLTGLAATAGGITTVSANLRYHHAVTPHLGVSIIPEFGHAEQFTIGVNVVGAKLAARISINGTNLEGWYLSPLAVAGWAWAQKADNRLASGAVLGAGVEGGYAWHWDHLALEVGAGAYYSALVGYSSFDRGPEPRSGLSPLLNVSAGYGW